MKTKSIIFLLATALFSLASCEKHEIVKEVDEEGEYRLEIDGLEETKGTAATVELNLANLSYVSSKNVSAQLKRKSGTSWVSVNDGVTYTWTASAADSKKFSGSGTVNKSCTIAAIAEGSGTMNVSASLNGSNVASTGVPVTVSDSRALTWSNATTTITSGTTYSATLTSNFSCTAAISSDNSSFVVGTSSSSLSSTVTADFTTNTTKTIYYKYTGSEETTVKMYESFGQSSVSISTIIPISNYGIGLSSEDFSSSLTIQKVWSFTGSTRIYINSPTGSWTYTKSPSSQQYILGEDEYTGLAYVYGFFDIYVISKNTGATSNRTATFSFFDDDGNQFGKLVFQHMNNKWTPTPDKD